MVLTAYLWNAECLSMLHTKCLSDHLNFFPPLELWGAVSDNFCKTENFTLLNASISQVCEDETVSLSSAFFNFSHTYMSLSVCTTECNTMNALQVLSKVSTVIPICMWATYSIAKIRWPTRASVLQLKKTHANTQNTSKLRKHHQFDNTFRTCATFIKHTANSLHKRPANTHNTTKYTTEVFPEDTKKCWTRLGHACCCHGLWLMKLLKSGPCIIRLCLCCGLLTSATALLCAYTACTSQDLAERTSGILSVILMICEEIYDNVHNRLQSVFHHWWTWLLYLINSSFPTFLSNTFKFTLIFSLKNALQTFSLNQRAPAHCRSDCACAKWRNSTKQNNRKTMNGWLTVWLFSQTFLVSSGNTSIIVVCILNLLVFCLFACVFLSCSAFALVGRRTMRPQRQRGLGNGMQPGGGYDGRVLALLSSMDIQEETLLPVHVATCHMNSSI